MDPRARYYRRMRRLRRSAGRWSVVGAGLLGAAAVLTPYAGIGPVDAIWAAAGGASAMLAAWRWADLRALRAQPPPPAPDPALVADGVRRRVETVVAALPGGREVLDELRRHRRRAKVRGSAVAPGWRRLDRASTALAELAPRLVGPGAVAVQEAAVAERGLRDLAERIAGVERAMGFGQGTHSKLAETHRALVERFERGVAAYEELVGAAAAYLAEGERSTVEHPSVYQLTAATDLLRGIAAGFAELRQPASRPD